MRRRREEEEKKKRRRREEGEEEEVEEVEQKKRKKKRRRRREEEEEEKMIKSREHKSIHISRGPHWRIYQFTLVGSTFEDLCWGPKNGAQTNSHY